MESLSEYIQVIASIVTMVATVTLSYYARVTIQEGKRDRSAMVAEAKKNRRKDLVEKALEEVYSPLYQILRRSMSCLGDVTLEKGVYTMRLHAETDTLPPTLHPLTDGDYEQICKILDKFGHLVPSEDYLDLTQKIETCVFDAATKRWQFNDDSNKIWNHVIGMRNELEAELRELTKYQLYLTF